MKEGVMIDWKLHVFFVPMFFVCIGGVYLCNKQGVLSWNLGIWIRSSPFGQEIYLLDF